MSEQLAHTLALWRRSPGVVYGSLDCMLAVSDHVLRVTGIDPAAPWRGAYSSAEDAERLIAEHGTLYGLAAYAMRRAGFRTGPPMPGYPAVADFRGHQMACLVVSETRCAFKGEAGAYVTRAPVLEAWVCRA